MSCIWEMVYICLKNDNISRFAWSKMYKPCQWMQLCSNEQMLASQYVSKLNCDGLKSDPYVSSSFISQLKDCLILINANIVFCRRNRIRVHNPIPPIDICWRLCSRRLLKELRQRRNCLNYFNPFQLLYFHVLRLFIVLW